MNYLSLSDYQTRSGLPASRGGVMQKGYGLRGVFKGIMRSAAPKLKQSLAYVGKRALKTGLERLEDVAAGGNLKSSLKKRARQTLMRFNTKVPRKRRVTEKKISIKRTAKKKVRRNKLIRHRDIFS